MSDATPLDATDRKVLATLMRNGRITWAQLATEIQLSPPSAAERVRRLEERGLISGYAALVRPEGLGCHMLAFVGIATAEGRHADAALLQWAASAAEVQECHVVAGEYDYLLKIRCHDAHDLERILRERVRSLPGVVRTNSAIVLSSPKETCVIPLASR